jgi:hypothetical protein
MASTAGAEVPGPERLEVVQTADGPRVLLAGVGCGTPFADAAARLGGGGPIHAVFGGTAPILAKGEIDGLKCSMVVAIGAAATVDEISLECEGGRLALRRLARRYRAALASLSAHEAPEGTWFGTFPLGALVALRPAEKGRPQALRVVIR